MIHTSNINDRSTDFQVLITVFQQCFQYYFNEVASNDIIKNVLLIYSAHVVIPWPGRSGGSVTLAPFKENEKLIKNSFTADSWAGITGSGEILYDDELVSDANFSMVP